MSTTFVYNTGEAEAGKDGLELVFVVFIEGTLDNRDSTDFTKNTFT